MKSRFKEINSTLEKILNKYNLESVYVLETLKAQWKEVGNTIAIHSVPVDFDNDTKKLKIKVNDQGWKKEFIENKKTLAFKINSKIKDVTVKQIDII